MRTVIFIIPETILHLRLCASISDVPEKYKYHLLIRPGELPLDDTFGFVAEHLASLISYVLSTKSVAEHDTLYPLHGFFIISLPIPKQTMWRSVTSLQKTAGCPPIPISAF